MMKFRPNVAAVILNQRGDKILMFHRVDGRRKGWQFLRAEWIQVKRKNKLF